MNAFDLERDEARRDRLFRWTFLGTGGLLLALYLGGDALGLLPEAYSVRAHARRRANPTPISEQYENFDPNLCLGIAIGSTRYRLNFALDHAIVTRPLFGVEEWVIPERFNYDGHTFLVTALDPFALLNAQGVRSVTLPASVRWFNGAFALAEETLARATLLQPDGRAQTFLPPFAELAQVQDRYPTQAETESAP